MSTNRIKLVVTYDGTDFCGWAATPGQRTVQRTLTDAVRQVSGEECEIIGASRTDSGAHARAQVCHFDSHVGVKPADWARALNRILPLDIGVKDSRQVSERFHSRFCALDRWYRYRIAIGPRNALEARFSHTYWRPLDLDAMQQAARHLVGAHDFLAFCEELDPHQHGRRELRSVEVRASGGQIWIDIIGLAFARGMMRRMSGGLLEVGRGRRTVQEFAALLDPKLRNDLMWPEVLPARGLTLMNIRYGRHPRDFRDRRDSGHDDSE